MNRHPMFVFVAAASLALAVFALPVLAGTTGKLTGRVTDKGGQPLIGANIILLGARLGAASDANGMYTILNVPPGTYELKANLIGHRPVTVTAVAISSDRTTKVDVTLEDEAVGLAEVVVTAKRPVVESDLTSTKFVVRAEDIAKLPVQDLQDVVNLQAGVVDGHIRGGRSGEVQYQVNGLSTNNLYDNSAGVRLDRSILQEVQVISGTFDAEYGQALSGVVNAVLKSGTERFEWSVEGYMGDYSFPSNEERLITNSLRPLSIYQLQGSMSGPLAGKSTTFLLSLRNYHYDDYFRGESRFVPTDKGDFENKVFVGTGDGLTTSLGYSHEWSGVAKVTNRSWQSVTASYEAIFNVIDSRRADFAWRLNPDGLATQGTTNLVHGIDWTQRLSPKSFYNVTLRQNLVDYTDWVYEDPWDPRYDAAGAPKSDPEYELGAIVQGVSLGRFEQHTDAIVGKAAWTNQVHMHHLVKAGVEFQFPDIAFGSPGTIVEGTVDGEQGLTRHFDEPPDYVTVQEYHPVLGAAFAQDQIEWRDLTVRAGLRMEYFDARSTIPSDLANPANSIDGAPESTPQATSTKVTFAPRVGVSYPVGARAAVFFSYGHFYQLPAMGQIFTNSDYSVLANLQAGDVRFGVMGNPDIAPEFTVQYEFGYKHAITPDLGLDFTAFYKDIRDLLGVEFVSTYAAAEYARLTNVDFGNILGVTLALDHRALGPFTATLDYTWQVGEGNSSDPRETATRAENGEDPRPRLVPLNWDQRHTLNFTTTIAKPGWMASMILRGVSGQPYTPEVTTGFGGTLESNSGRKQNAILVDLRGERAFPAFGPLRLFARVLNLFDARAFNGFVFNDTGSPDYTRNPSSQEATLANPLRYYQPRRIEIGFTANGILGGGGAR